MAPVSDAAHKSRTRVELHRYTPRHQHSRVGLRATSDRLSCTVLRQRLPNALTIRPQAPSFPNTARSRAWRSIALHAHATGFTIRSTGECHSPAYGGGRVAVEAAGGLSESLGERNGTARAPLEIDECIVSGAGPPRGRSRLSMPKPRRGPAGSAALGVHEWQSYAGWRSGVNRIAARLAATGGTSRAACGAHLETYLVRCDRFGSVHRCVPDSEGPELRVRRTGMNLHFRSQRRASCVDDRRSRRQSRLRRPFRLGVPLGGLLAERARFAPQVAELCHHDADLFFEHSVTRRR